MRRLVFLKKNIFFKNYKEVSNDINGKGVTLNHSAKNILFSTRLNGSQAMLENQINDFFNF